MALSAFADKTHPPTDEDLATVLGPAYAPWSRLIGDVAAQIPGLACLWAFTSKGTGWGLRLRHRDRVIVYLTPCEGHFLVSFVLGEKAVIRARAAKLPGELLSAIDAAPRYAEGRGVRLHVRGVRQLASIVALARIKHES